MLDVDLSLLGMKSPKSVIKEDLFFPEQAVLLIPKLKDDPVNRNRFRLSIPAKELLLLKGDGKDKVTLMYQDEKLYIANMNKSSLKDGVTVTKDGYFTSKLLLGKIYKMIGLVEGNHLCRLNRVETQFDKKGFVLCQVEGYITRVPEKGMTSQEFPQNGVAENVSTDNGENTTDEVEVTETEERADSDLAYQKIE